MLDMNFSSDLKHFSPEIIEKKFRTPIDELIDLTISQYPIDYRRILYSDIVLANGSTSFKNFNRRLEMSLIKRVDERYAKYFSYKKSDIKVKVSHPLFDLPVVWLGGSWLASGDEFKRFVHTREEYQEKGPSCCRLNSVFTI